MDKNNRLAQQACRRALSVPPYAFSAVAVAVGVACNGLTIQLPGGMGARVRFEKVQ